jgi:hypothetical protein
MTGGDRHRTLSVVGSVCPKGLQDVVALHRRWVTGTGEPRQVSQRGVGNPQVR